MIKTSCKRFNTAKEYLEEQIRIGGSDLFYYEFDKYGRCWIDVCDSTSSKCVDNSQEMIEIASNHLEKYGKVHFEGLGGTRLQLEGGYNQAYGCTIGKTPRPTKKEILKRYRLERTIDILIKERRRANSLNEIRNCMRERFKVHKVLNTLLKQYDWRDELFREDGLVGLRNVNGDILVPCGNYDFIHGCNYGDNTTLAIASRNGLYGLIRRDGKGSVVIPFKYIDIERLDYNKSGVAVDKEFNLHIGYRKVSHYLVADIIVNGQVVVSDAGNFFWSERGGIEYFKYQEESVKTGFLGIYWDWILVEDMIDEVKLNDEQPYYTFLKDGEEGVLTTNKEFIPLKKWNIMTEEQQDEIWEDIIGCLRIDWTTPIPIVG